VGKLFKKEVAKIEDYKNAKEEVKKVDRKELKNKQKRLFLLTDGEVSNPD
jgi:hypothetical protein